MLLNSFFIIGNISIEGEKTIVDIEIDKEDSVFEGHFPDNPVVPGVFLIQMVRETIEVLQKKKFRIEKSDEIKFVNMVIPQQSGNIKLEIQQRIKIDCSCAYYVIITDGITLFLKMKVDFAIGN